MSRKNPTRRLKSKAENLYRRYRAVKVLTNGLSVEERQRMDKSLENIQRMEPDELRTRLPEIEKETDDLCKLYGVIGELEDLEKYVGIKEDQPPIRFLAKFGLEQLFTHYEHRLPMFSDLPPHARIGIECQGARDKNQIEVFILEASLFEDMAALWNATLELHQALDLNYQKEKKKQRDALARATAKAVFNLIEGYLNSLALDILLTKTATDKQEVLLTEWDSEESRPKFLSLRDKLLQYPKIALGAVHPPLTENNCPEIGKIVELENNLRHSLIHPTPQASEKEPALYREQTYLHLSIDQVDELCDLSIDLVDKINNAINGMFGDVNKLWLKRRDKTGFFSADVFR